MRRSSFVESIGPAATAQRPWRSDGATQDAGATKTISALKARLDPVADAVSSGLKTLARDTRRRPRAKTETEVLPDDPAWHAALVGDHPPRVGRQQSGQTTRPE